MQIRCSECGQFVSFEDKEAMAYTSFYVEANEPDPPDEQYICGKCWRGMSTERKGWYIDPSQWRHCHIAARRMIQDVD